MAIRVGQIPPESEDTKWAPNQTPTGPNFAQLSRRLCGGFIFRQIPWQLELMSFGNVCRTDAQQKQALQPWHLRWGGGCQHPPAHQRRSPTSAPPPSSAPSLKRLFLRNIPRKTFHLPLLRSRHHSHPSPSNAPHLLSLFIEVFYWGFYSVDFFIEVFILLIFYWFFFCRFFIEVFIL